MIECSRGVPARSSLLIFLLLLMGPIALWANPRDVFEEGERRFSSGNFTLAIERYEHLLGAWPGSQFTGQAQFRIAQSHFYLGNYGTALDRFQRSAARAPAGEASQRIRFWIGLTLFQLDRHEETVEMMSRYLNLPADQRGRALLYRSLSLLELGDLSAARQDLTAALPQVDGAEQGYALAALMQVLTQAGDDESVIALWREWGDQMDRDDGYQEQRIRYAADAAFRQLNIDLAADLYEELTTFSLDSAQWGFQQLSVLAQNAGDRGRTQEIFRRAERRLAVEPQRMREFWFALGLDALESERFELAEQNFIRIWELRDDAVVSGLVPLLLARVIENQGRREEALELLQQSMVSSRVSPEVRDERALSLARMLLLEERPADAAAVLETVSSRRENVAMLYGWTFALYRSGRGAEALPVLEDNSLQPLMREEPELLRLRARLLLEANRAVDAVRTYRTLLQERPDADAVVRLELLRALVGAEQFSAAAQEARRIAAADLTPRGREDFLYLQGLTAFNNGEWRDVIALLQQLGAARFEPLRSYHLAWALYREGDVAGARDTVAAVIEDLPRSLAFDGGYLYSWTLFRSGQSGQSARQILRLLGLAADRDQEIQARQLLATVYLDQRAVEDALVQYRLLLDLARNDNDRGAFWSQYASILAAIGRSEEAVTEYDALHRALPQTAAGATALLEAGQILFTESLFAEARDRFRMYRNVYPEGADLDRSLYWAGAASLELGEAGRALLWWEPLFQQFPRSTYTPRALIETAAVYEARGQQRQALELYDRFVAAYADNPRSTEAETARRRIRLEIDGLSNREATLWVELERIGEMPSPGNQRDRWFALVLELGRISIREQISLTAQAGRRGLIVDYLIAGSAATHPDAGEAALLLAEYYRRRGENRAAIEQYLRVAAIPDAPEDLAAQGLYELAVLARQEGEGAVIRDAVRELNRRFPESVWADRAQRLLEQ